MNDQPKCPYCGVTVRSTALPDVFICGTSTRSQGFICAMRQRDQLAAENATLRSNYENYSQASCEAIDILRAQLAAKTAEFEKLKAQRLDDNYVSKERWFRAKDDADDLRSKCERLEKERDEIKKLTDGCCPICGGKSRSELCSAWHEQDSVSRERDSLRAQVAQLEKEAKAFPGEIVGKYERLAKQNAELCAVLEKKDDGIRAGMQAYRILRPLIDEEKYSLPYSLAQALEKADAALALKPDSTALDNLVKPLGDALEKIAIGLPRGFYLSDYTAAKEFARQALADWKERRQ